MRDTSHQFVTTRAILCGGAIRVYHGGPAIPHVLFARVDPSHVRDDLSDSHIGVRLYRESTRHGAPGGNRVRTRRRRSGQATMWTRSKRSASSKLNQRPTIPKRLLLLMLFGAFCVSPEGGQYGSAIRERPMNAWRSIRNSSCHSFIADLGRRTQNGHASGHGKTLLPQACGTRLAAHAPASLDNDRD